MKIIITAAGKGNRFKERGINTPKYKIVAKNKSLFYLSMISMKSFFDNEFIFIFLKENYDDVFIKNELKKLGINKYKILLINSLTDGQATTTFEANHLIEENESIVIFNIDTHICSNTLTKFDLLKGDGCIVTTDAEGDHWSFAKVGEDGYVEEVSEKTKISDNASVGVYWFRKWKYFRDIYLKHKEEVKFKYKETYICPMYKYLIDNGKKITIHHINKNNFLCLGTPEEISKYDENWIKFNA